MNKLINAINLDYTQNGALTNASSGSRLLDFYGQVGALRAADESRVGSQFSDAYNEDKLLALKIAFYGRDVRGGQGERKTFRAILKWLAANDPEVLVKNLSNLAYYGRYDDLINLLKVNNTRVRTAVLEEIQTQLERDTATENPSLLGKWLPSINASSQETKALGRLVAKSLGMKEREYRKLLSSLRRKIKVLERLMCSKSWDEIDYERVPSRAGLIYRKAFSRDDNERYGAYLGAVSRGEAVIKADTLYPYDLTRAAEKYGLSATEISTLDAQWNALPNYLSEEFGNGLVVTDVSGSMQSNNGLPMQVSVSLAMYISERNSGAFKDYFITFSDRPTLQKVSGNNIVEKVRNLKRADWSMSTNLQAVFDLVLNRAVEKNVPESEMPDVIYIVSDMQFNVAVRDNNRTNFEEIQRKYAANGYKMPKLVFWNVDAKKDESPITIDDRGVVLVSGASPSILKSVLSGKSLDALGLMMETITSERYDRVVI